MLKLIRNIRLAISYLGYLVALYMLNTFGIIKQIELSTDNAMLVIIVGSVLLFLMTLIVTYFGKNSNYIYYTFYSIMTAAVVFSGNIKSEFLFFEIAGLILMIAIFCQYLYMVEYKVENVLYKNAEPEELKKCYKKYLLILLGFLAAVYGIIVLGYKLIQTLSAILIVYFYKKNTFFSLPAIAGFVAIVLICTFFLAMFFGTGEEDI